MLLYNYSTYLYCKIGSQRRSRTPNNASATMKKSRYRYASASDFLYEGSKLASKYHETFDIKEPEMVRTYGATSIILEKLWNGLIAHGRLSKRSKPLHLMWWLAMVKQYHTNEQFERFTQYSCKTTRKYMKKIQRAMVRYIPRVVSVWLQKVYDDTKCVR